MFGVENIFEAVREGDIDELQKFINTGDVNKVAANGTTALMEACIKGHVEAVKLLLQAGANINAEDGIEYTALMHAVVRSHKDIVNLLLEKNPETEDALEKAEDRGLPEMVSLLKSYKKGER